MTMLPVDSIRVTLSLNKEVVAKLDQLAKDFKTTRSGMVTNFVLMIDAFEENKQLGVLVTKLIKGALK